MVMFCGSGSVIVKAGVFINPDIQDTTFVDVEGATVYAVERWIENAECEINAFTRYNWIDAYSALNADVKLLLGQVASDLAAIEVIKYDMSGSTLREAENRINVLRDSALRGLSILRDEKVREFIKDA